MPKRITIVPRPRGQPPRDPEGPRSHQISLRVTPELIEAIDQVRGGVPRNQWINRLLRAATGRR